MLRVYLREGGTDVPVVRCDQWSRPSSYSMQVCLVFSVSLPIRVSSLNVRSTIYCTGFPNCCMGTVCWTPPRFIPESSKMFGVLQINVNLLHSLACKGKVWLMFPATKYLANSYCTRFYTFSWDQSIDSSIRKYVHVLRPNYFIEFFNTPRYCSNFRL